PGPGDQPVQFVGVRDLASWILHASGRGLVGPYNATGPAAPMTMQELLEAIREAVGGDARLEWAPERFLLERKIEPWSDLPLWLAPEANPQFAGFLTMGIGRALAEGLTFRP